MIVAARRAAAAVCAAASVLAVAPAFAAGVAIDSNVFGALRARSIGPAVMSGRIMAVDATASDPLTIWVGAASGGVWRSRDGGIAWVPVFDDHAQSIGAVRIDPSTPDNVWIGSGESCTRNSVSVGDGVYRTTDGGETWTHLGLEGSERIADIVVHPADGDVAWVCATGALWNASDERGVFKTVDGGESWTPVLFVDDSTGCSDLAIDPQEPDILYAGMWQFRRYPDYFESGGPGSGLYQSFDGGETWSERTDGLPRGNKGRIAIAVAPSRPNRVYAVVEADDSALFRSDDLGATWEQVNTSFAATGRPFYFSHLLVDPSDHDRVYKPGFYLGVSTDGGKSFSSMLSGAFDGGVHPDHHALWVNPANPHELVLGTDGGVYMSYNRGSTFRQIRALPVSQFYEISTDMDVPYNVYGGLQDNGSWVGPSRAPGGIRNADWRSVGYGDGFHTYRDPHDPDLVYAEYQGGNLLRHRVSTGEIQEIAPLPGKDQDPFRYNWNTALHLSPNTPGTLYYGAQFLFRSRDRGDTWERISPDLTTDDPMRQRQASSGGLSIDNSTAENNATIYTIGESPLDADTIWVGTDDGRVHVTRDGGVHWTDVTAAVPGVPEGTWVSHVEPSPLDVATAHLAFDGHRTGDMATYVFRTEDHGASWTSLVSEGLEGYVHVIVQDPVRSDLLYAGTEFGLYLSIDGGGHWARFDRGIPRVPVHDVDVHPRDHDLIVGTHGRGIYILDDLTPLRALTTATLESKVALLPSRDAVMTLNATTFGFPGQDEFVGRNPPEAASIVYFLARRHIFGDLEVEILDADGDVIATVPGGKLKGINRVDWPMRLPAPEMPPATALAPAFLGPRVPEGTYRFRLTKGKQTLEGSVRLVPDPRSPHTAEDRGLQQTTALELYDMLARLTYVVDATIDLHDRARERRDAPGTKDRLATRLATLIDELDAFRSSLVSTSKAGMLSGDAKLRENLAGVYSAVVGYDGRPTGSQVERTASLRGELEDAESTFAGLVSAERLDGLNRTLESAGAEPLRPMTREAWEDGRDGAGSAASGNLAPRELRALVREALAMS